MAEWRELVQRTARAMLAAQEAADAVRAEARLRRAEVRATVERSRALRAASARLRAGWPAPPGCPQPVRREVWTVAGRRREVAVWDMARWNRFPPDKRPAAAVYIGGLGWVVLGPEVVDGPEG